MVGSELQELASASKQMVETLAALPPILIDRNNGDCGTCKNCKDKKKFGGPGKKKASCVLKL